LKRRPNILLITTDQQRHDHMGVGGLAAVPTPNLDRLGTEGVHFARAYAPSPLCTPARVSLLTGRYPSLHGAYSVGVSVHPFPRPTIADMFSAAGYETALLGKTHFVAREDEASHVTGQPEPAPEAFREFHGPYVGFQHVQTCGGHTINTIPDMHYRVFLEDAGVDYRPWFPRFGPDYDHHYCGPWNLPAQYHDTAWVGGMTEAWIRQHADGAPWFCWSSFQDPHEPFACPEPWFSRVEIGGLEPYEGVRPGEFDNKPAFYRQAAAGDWSMYDDGCGVPCSFYTPERDERAVTALAATLGMVAFIDDRVGAILRALEQTGQADNTLVVFTGDHGEMHGHHGFWGKGLTAYEDCQRVPLLVWGPGLVERQGTTQALANLIDLPRTFLSLAEIEISLGMQGVDLAPLLRGQADRVQDFTVVECQPTRKVYQQTLITERYKLILYRDTNEAELYDLEEDPDQYENLWRRPGYESLKSELLQLFARAGMKREGRIQPRIAFA